MVIGAITKGSQRFKRTYEMVKRLECFRRFQVRKGTRTFQKRFQSLLKYLWPFRVRKGVGNSEAVLKWHFQNETSEPPEPLCGSQLNTVTDDTRQPDECLPQLLQLMSKSFGSPPWEKMSGMHAIVERWEVSYDELSKTHSLTWKQTQACDNNKRRTVMMETSKLLQPTAFLSLVGDTLTYSCVRKYHCSKAIDSVMAYADS